VTSPEQPTQVTETHVSRLFFVGDRVLKQKKAVQTGFLDFREPTAREAACHREVELNRRLAPDVYLGVADVSMEGRPVDHLVVMRRLPPDRRLTALVDDPSVRAHLRRVARVVADFHSRAERSRTIDEAGTAEFVTALWRSGLEQVERFAPEVLDPEELERARGLALEYLSGRRPLFDQRLRQGRTCDGHGDLQAEDVFCLDDGPRILDCLEFDDRLRHGDVAGDVAFLAMDLERVGHPELGAELVARYQELTADHWPASLGHHYVAYRAHIRSKVACLRHEQGDPGARATARSLHRLALDHLEAGRVTMTLVGGAPGRGKSTLARALGASTGAVVLSSDEVRDDLLPRSGAAGQVDGGRYRPELVARVYEELLARAEVLLAHGEPVILDASWSEAPRRELVRAMSTRVAAPVLEIRCTCPDEVAARRIEDRRRRGTDASEATVDVADALSARFDAWPEAVSIDTSPPPGEVADRARRHVTERLAGTPAVVDD